MWTCCCNQGEGADRLPHAGNHEQDERGGGKHPGDITSLHGASISVAHLPGLVDGREAYIVVNVQVFQQ